jgi:hypothetical protein
MYKIPSSPPITIPGSHRIPYHKRRPIAQYYSDTDDEEEEFSSVDSEDPLRGEENVFKNEMVSIRRPQNIEFKTYLTTPRSRVLIFNYVDDENSEDSEDDSVK